MRKKQTIWAVKEHGRPEWDKYVGYTYNCIKGRIETLEETERKYEVVCYAVGENPAWQN